MYMIGTSLVGLTFGSTADEASECRLPNRVC